MSSVVEPLEFVFKWVNSWTKVDPAVPLFDLSTSSKILAKNNLYQELYPLVLDRELQNIDCD